MIETETIRLSSIALHHIGSKPADEGIHFSKEGLQLDISITDLLKTYFLSPFKSEEYYNLYHESDLNLNEVFNYVSQIFENPDKLHEQSVKIAKHLYERSNHPKIKSGELYVAYFRDCVVEGELMDAVGFFKSETKDTFLKVHSMNQGFEIESESGININKLDKGCLIFNTEREAGYIVAVVDTTSKGSEAQYWVDQFLHLRPRRDEYFQTKNALNLCKSYVIEKMPSEFDVSKADQAEMLNKSVAFFKQNDSFDLDDFAHSVIQAPDAIQSFLRHKSDYEESRDIRIDNNFDISDSAVKKQSRVFKSVIKLDKSFHIYVHGDNKNIVKGFDQESGMHYYQIFFKEES
jgi:hypothetical protein